MKEVTIPQMLNKLDNMFINEKQLKNVILKKCNELEQLQEDIELLQLMIIHKSNSNARH